MGEWLKGDGCTALAGEKSNKSCMKSKLSVFIKPGTIYIVFSERVEIFLFPFTVTFFPSHFVVQFDGKTVSQCSGLLPEEGKHRFIQLLTFLPRIFHSVFPLNLLSTKLAFHGLVFACLRPARAAPSASATGS